jgi:hypothetical protein
MDLKSLTSLELSPFDFTDHGLEYLKGLKNLQSLRNGSPKTPWKSCSRVLQA